MIRVVFLGYGNVNYHLCKMLHTIDDVTVCQIYNRSDVLNYPREPSIPFTRSLSELMEADIYIVGIPDDAITLFSEQIPLKNKLVVHTSGGVEMNALSSKNRKGVFYPLQSFSKIREIDFKKIPVCIEAENDSDLKLLHKLGSYLSEKVVKVNSEQRLKLHLAAVFVNNFTNYMYQIGSDIAEESDLPFDLLQPLIAETAMKIESLSPIEAQTGPARRNDLKTIEKHLHLLQQSPYKELYEHITKAIQSTYGKKL